MRKIVVLASGSGSLLQALIDANENHKIFQIVAVISDQPDAYALKRAHSEGIPTVVVEFKKEEADAWQEKLKMTILKYQPDLVVSAGFMRIIKSDVFHLVPTINAHPSLLPMFPGKNAVAEALAAKVKKTGATVHFIDSGVDTGEIIAQTEVPIMENDTIDVLHERIKSVEREQLVSVVVKLCQQAG
jgi:phosphoribosylglycinamide formyltransferase-1